MLPFLAVARSYYLKRYPRLTGEGSEHEAFSLNSAKLSMLLYDIQGVWYLELPSNSLWSSTGTLATLNWDMSTTCLSGQDQNLWLFQRRHTKVAEKPSEKTKSLGLMMC